MSQLLNKQRICEENTYNTIYNTHAKPLRNFIYYRCGDMQKSEDIVQEVMVSLWENCVKIIFEKAKAFLYTAARNLLIDQARHEKVKLEFIKQIGPAYTEDPSHKVIRDEFEQKLEAAISDLPEAQRETFLMNRIDKLSYQEIANTLNISIKAVEKRMHLALLHLKNKVEELNYIKI